MKENDTEHTYNFGTNYIRNSENCDILQNSFKIFEWS
jgi:hypothetical protein